MAALLSLCLPGCGAQRATTTAPDDSWQVTFLVSGGFAGLDRQLVLASSGDATATDRRRNRQVTRPLSRDALKEIDSLIASAVSIDLPNRTQCRDCYAYDIDVRTPKRQVTIRAGDDALGDSSAALLARALTRLVGQLLSEP